eukprot:3070891-Pyramimonas_sp.AAC.1
MCIRDRPTQASLHHGILPPALPFWFGVHQQTLGCIPITVTFSVTTSVYLVCCHPYYTSGRELGGATSGKEL